MGPRVYRFRGVGGCTHRTGRAARPFRRVVCIFVMNGSLFLYVKTVCAFRPEPESRIHRCGLSVNNPLLTHRISYPTPPPPPRKRDLDNMNMNGQKYKIHSRLQGQGGGLTGLCSSLCFSRLTLAASELLLFCVPLLCLCWACSFTTPPPCLHPAALGSGSDPAAGTPPADAPLSLWDSLAVGRRLAFPQFQLNTYNSLSVLYAIYGLLKSPYYVHSGTSQRFVSADATLVSYRMHYPVTDSCS